MINFSLNWLSTLENNLIFLSNCQLLNPFFHHISKEFFGENLTVYKVRILI